MTATRRVLVLAYFFPPLGGAGVQRTLKALKYLPEHGWRATVVTTSSTTYPVSDPSLTTEIPAGTRVVRAFEPRSLAVLQRLAVIAFSRLGLRTLRDLAGWPDLMAGWGAFALAAALRETQRERPDVLYSTAAPHSCHIVAGIVHRLTGIPWVADFRDEWSANPHGAEAPLARRLSRRVERWITSRATFTTIAADYFRIAGARPEDVVLIPNGVDEEDVAGEPAASAPRTVDAPLRLSHVGTLYDVSDPGPVLDAMRRLIAAGRLDPRAVELRVVGSDWLPHLDARVPVTLTRAGYVVHEEAIAEMRSADALLLYVAATSLAPSGKLFEYLVSGRPILCVAHSDNLASQLVREWNAGIWAAPNDGEAIERAILELLARRRAGTLVVDPAVRRRTLARYSRRALAGQLVEVLEAAAKRTT
jgi:glycosyltransferase involved in cell wall biosynthesis